jgi:ribosomal protein S1
MICFFFLPVIVDIIGYNGEQEKSMKVQGVIHGSNIVLKRVPAGEQFNEGDSVEVIILPSQKKPHRFSTFKLGIRKEFLNREKMYERS